MVAVWISAPLLLLLAGACLLWRRTQQQLQAARAKLSFQDDNQKALAASARWIEEERRILEMVATGSPLKDILDAITLSIEQQSGDCLASILLLDESRKHLLHGSAPNLPAAYSKAIHGMAIGPLAGSCGTAAYLKTMVIVEDIETDVKWTAFKDLAVAHGLRACWSFPIRDSRQQMIGTFAQYHRFPACPTHRHLEMARSWARLAAVAIENRTVSESLARYARRMEIAEQAAQFGIWEYDFLTRRISASPNLKAILNPGPDIDMENSAMAKTRLHPDDVGAFVASIAEAAQTGWLWKQEYRFAGVSSEYRWFRSEGRVERDANGLAIRLIGATQDVNEEREMRSRLEQSRQSAEDANAIKSRFLANMSHEIRTPLNGLIGSVSLLKEMPAPPEQRVHLNTISTSAESLLQVVNDILDFSKVEAGKIELEQQPLSLVKVLDDVRTIMGPQAIVKEIDLRFDVSPAGDELYYLGDSLRLRQIMLNLVSNGIKFTNRGSVVVAVECSDGLQHFRVTDTGIGMTESATRSIFEPFTQADSSTTRRYGGSGLGLSITSHLVRLMGGNIELTSAPGQGSTFAFRLALASCDPPDRLAVPVAFATPATETSLRILIAEDNGINQAVAQRLLERLGHQVDVVSNGREAVAAAVLQDPPFDAILMDCQMPEVDGLQATTLIRQQGITAFIIALTANAFSEDRQRCLDSGMDDYLSKPIDLDRLRSALARAAKRSEDPAESIANSSL
jgi:signal transduction histidine kinase/ActR/RegA family two-component response regulator